MYDKITGHLRWFSSKSGQITNISNITPGEKMFKNSCRLGSSREPANATTDFLISIYSFLFI